jgi:hypothetical protein
MNGSPSRCLASFWAKSQAQMAIPALSEPPAPIQRKLNDAKDAA